MNGVSNDHLLGPGFSVITHELGHDWFPMMVGSNETWYGWQDEGFNEFIDAAAAEDHDRKPTDWDREGASYRKIPARNSSSP